MEFLNLKNITKKIVEKAIKELENKVDTTDCIKELRFTPQDILLKRDIDFINKLKFNKEYQERTKTWKDYTREEQADLIMRYVDDIELDLIGKEVIVKQINFRESICKPCKELFEEGYIDTTKPAIFGSVLGNIRFSNYYLKEIQETAQTRVDTIVSQLKEKNDLQEDLKNTNPLYWTGMMNNFKLEAEEIVYRELICV